MKSKYINLKDNDDYEKLKAPAEAIKHGELVLFPTETALATSSYVEFLRLF